MKTIFRVSVLTGLFLLSLTLLICSQLNAQTIISIDSAADSTVVMNIQNDVLSENPQKFILIIDNAPASCQLSEEEVLAWLDLRHSNFVSPVNYKKTLKDKTIDEQDKKLMDYLMRKTLVEANEVEDEMEIEDWMFCSENWIED